MDKQQIDDFAARYRKVNGSFTKKLVFRAGIDAEFFAEFKYMVNAVVYCLQNKIQFCLYSRGANFGKGGWSEFFEPFCTEVEGDFNSRWNVHRLPPLGELRRRNPNIGTGGLLLWKLKTALRGSMYRLISWREYGRPALSTYDIPQTPPAHCRIPEMGLDCTYDEAFRKVASMLWRLNAGVREQAHELMRSISLPEHYASMQIRGGDKITEVSLLSPATFVAALRKATGLKDILLLTDDYGLLESVRRDYPEYSWYSLCTPQERGYVNSAFTQTDAETKHRRMVRFLAQVDAMLHGDAFVGSITVGPSLFVLQMLYPKGTPVDCDTKELPMAAHLAIKERGEIAARYLAKHAR